MTIAEALPQVHVLTPLRFQGISVFPLMRDDASAVGFLLSDEALKARTLQITEQRGRADYTKLEVRNTGDLPVLFLAGEVFEGGGQNRVINTTVLVPAHETVIIPVSCVERSRWNPGRGQGLQSTGTTAPPTVAETLVSSVTISLERGQGHGSEQGSVWREVTRTLESADTVSPTESVSQVFVQHQAAVKRWQDALQYSPSASGLAIAIGSTVRQVHLFDSAATCEKVWERMISGPVLEAMNAPAAESPHPADVVRVLVEASRARWNPVTASQSIGSAEETRASFGSSSSGTVVSLEDSLVHASMIVPV